MNKILKLYEVIARNKLFLLTFLVFIIMYFFGLGSYPLITPDEARYAEVAREMLAKHDFITPTLNYFIFFDKPILYYWLTAIAIKIFGVTEFAARFWSSIFGLSTVFATYFFTKRIYGLRAGYLAAVILGLSPLFFGGAHFSNMDIQVASWITYALYFFLLGILPQAANQRVVTGKLKKPSNYAPKATQVKFLYLSYLCAALAVLTKGLIGLAFPAMIIGLWMVFTREWRILSNMRLISGFILIAVIVAPWFMLVGKRNPEFFHYFFYIQQFQRYLTPNFNSHQPFWFYPAILVGGMLPWSCFFPGAFAHAWKSIKTHKKYNVELFLIIWAIAITLFFSVPQSKLMGYILPVCPPLAILVGIYLAARWEQGIWGIKVCTYKSLTSILSIISILSLIIFYPTISMSLIKNKTFYYLLNQATPTISMHTKIVSYGNYYYDIPYYLQRRIYLVTDWEEPGLKSKDNWASPFAYAKEYQAPHAQYLLSFKEFWRLWESPQPVRVAVSRKRLPDFSGKHYIVLSQDKNHLILSNQAR